MADPTLILNGRQCPFEPGDTILEVARRHGVFVPTLCHLEHARPTGACRVCVVEVEGARTLAPACATPAADGMVVRTDSPAVLLARRRILGLLLQAGNHNCTSRHRDDAHWAAFQREVAAHDGADELCEAYGDCRLQSYAYRYQVDSRDLAPRPSHYPLEDAGPLIVRDFSRCILCGRCIQACNEIQVNNAISHGYRGAVAKIVAMGDGLLARSECVACGECVQACPVGALVEKKARYRIRPWEARRVRTTCSYCAVGCQLVLHVKDDRIHKVTGVESAAPNLGRLCVRGRYGFDFVHSPRRLTEPRLRAGDAWRRASWDEALDRAAEIVAATVAAHGPEAVAMVCSARSSNEALFAWQRLLREVIGSPNVVTPAAAGGMEAPLESLEKAPVVLLVASDLTVEHPVAATCVKRGVVTGHRLIVVDHRVTAIADRATLHLPARSGSEGVLVEGLIQAVRARGRDRGPAGPVAFDPEAVAAATGVAAEQLARAAELLDEHGPATVVYGAPVSHLAPRLTALQEALGAPGREGGAVHHLGAQANSLGAVYMGAVEDRRPGGFEPAISAGLSFDRLVADLAAAPRPRTRCLLVCGENLAAAAVERGEIARALARVEHLVVVDGLETDTHSGADVLLPSTVWAEEDGTVVNAEHRIQRFVQALPAAGEARPATWIAAELARRLGRPWPERTARQWWDDAIVPAIPALDGLTADALGADGGMWPAGDGGRVGARPVPWVGHNYAHRTLVECCTGVLESLPRHSRLGTWVPACDPDAVRSDFERFLVEEELVGRRAAVDEVLAAARRRPGGLIPALQQVQELLGYLPPAVQNYIALALGRSAAEVYGVTSFYAFFTMKPRGRHLVRVCLGTACYVVGSGLIVDALKEHLAVEVGGTTADRCISLEGVRCVGACGLAPVVVVDGEAHGGMTFEKTRAVLDPLRDRDAGAHGDDRPLPVRPAASGSDRRPASAGAPGTPSAAAQRGRTTALRPQDLERIRDSVRGVVNLRDGDARVKVTVHLGTCGLAAGAQRIVDVMTEEIERRQLADVLLTSSGCAGLCNHEPMMTVEVRGEPPVKYARLDADRARRVFEEHVVRGAVVAKLALAVGCERTSEWSDATAPGEVARGDARPTQGAARGSGGGP